MPEQLHVPDLSMLLTHPSPAPCLPLCCIIPHPTANYNGTCPKSIDAPMVGEMLFEPKKGCDFSITLEEGPDFFVTSHTAGACDKNLKVYIHAVCIKSDNTFVSGLFNNLPALPSMPSFRHSLSRGGPASEMASLPAAGYSNVVSGLPADLAAVGGDVAPGAGAQAGLRPATRLSVSSSDPAVLEAAKQSSAADVRPVLASLLMAAGAMALVL